MMRGCSPGVALSAGPWRCEKGKVSTPNRASKGQAVQGSSLGSWPVLACRDGLRWAGQHERGPLRLACWRPGLLNGDLRLQPVTSRPLLPDNVNLDREPSSSCWPVLQDAQREQPCRAPLGVCYRPDAVRQVEGPVKGRIRRGWMQHGVL